MELRKTWVTSTRITVNGVTYAKVEDMPPDIREKYEAAMKKAMADEDGNGVPDVFEHPPADPAQTNVAVTSQRFVVNGKTYDRIEDLPAELREAVTRALPSALPTGVSADRAFDGNATFPYDASRGDGVWLHISSATIVKLIIMLIAAGVVVWLMHR